MKTNWEDLAATSYHAALSAIKTEIERGDLAEALAGLTEMIATEYRSVRMGVKDELAKAMQYTIVCKYAPQGNIKGEWLGGLCRARGCIDSFCEDYGFVDRGFIEAEWEGALGWAKTWALSETGISPDKISVSWDDVFEADYGLPSEDGKNDDEKRAA